MKNPGISSDYLAIIILSIVVVVSSNDNSTSINLLIGDSVQLNCTILSSTHDSTGQMRFAPTWLKADARYSEHGKLVDYKTENIIVTRKGVVVDAYRDKVHLNTLRGQVQVLTLMNVDARDEGKYICRRFNSNNDQYYFIRVHGELETI
jgi:hypothetical protein